MEKGWEGWCVEMVERLGLDTYDRVACGDVAYNLCSFPLLFNTVCTVFAQVLHMEAFLDLRYGFTEFGINPNLLFDLFDGVDGCGVVFAAKFTGDLGEA